MCGVVGMLDLEGRPADGDLLARMLTRLRHRGPDGEGVSLDGPLGLGHRRLAILDPGPTGAQPMVDPSGRFRIGFNGECLNHRELRKELAARGHRFIGRTDTEVVLAGFAAHGPAFLDRMDGMFAFAVWDARDRVLHLVRDRLGIKPMYFAREGGRLLFASEVRPLLEAGVPAEVDPEALRCWLSLRYVPGPRTIFRAIRRLDPGGHLVARPSGESVLHRWWTLPQGESDPAADRAEAAAALFERLARAVDDATYADVPVGAFLSGGIDSAAVVALASRALPALPAFTYGMPAPDDETATAAAVAATVGARHVRVPGAGDDWQAYAEAVVALEEPLGDAIIAPTWRLAQAASRQVKVVLTGEGADEALGGYVHHEAMARLLALRRLVPRAAVGALARAVLAIPGPAWNALTPYPGRPGASTARRVAAALRVEGHPARACTALIALFDPAEQEGLLLPDVLRAAPDPDGAADALESRWGAGPGVDPLNAMLRADLAGWNADYNLLRIDRLTMAHGVEARVPFLDHRLVELSLRLPGRFKIHRSGRKLLLRQALAGRGVVPEAVRTGAKRPFQIAVSRAYDAGWEALIADTLSDAATRRRGWMRPEGVAAVRDKPRGDLLADKQRAALVLLELWARAYQDGGWRSA